MAAAGTATSSRLQKLVGFTLVVAILYFAKELLLPLALSVLLSFLLLPIVVWLERRGVWRIAAILVAVGLAFLLVAGLTWFMGGQVADLANQLPAYKKTIQSKTQALQEWAGGIGQYADWFKELQGQVPQTDTKTDAAKKSDPISAPPGTPAETPTPKTPLANSENGEPVKVEVVSDRSDPLAYRLVRNALLWVIGPLGQAALVIVTTIFILLQREDLRNRVIKLAGTRNLHETTEAIDEASARVSRYLLMQLVINATYGIAVALGLFFIGVPNAILWGVLATVFRFIPYIGPWVAALLPLALSIAVFEGWYGLLATVALFVVLELISNNVMEPWLYGNSTGMSAVGVIVAAAFWTWLWGPIGLVLSMPLTVCLIVMGRYVPQLKFISILLSDEPALAEDVRFYQRLLAFDDDEASELLGTAIKQDSPEAAYTRMVMPALRTAESDRQASQLSEAQRRYFYRFLRAQVRGISAVTDAAGEPANPPLSIMCLPTQDANDRLAGRILAALLARHGHTAEALPMRAGSRQVRELLRERQPTVVVLSALAPGSTLAVQRAVERLRDAAPATRIVVGLWATPGDLTRKRQRLQAAGAEFVTASLTQAIDYLQKPAAALEKVHD